MVFSLLTATVFSEKTTTETQARHSQKNSREREREMDGQTDRGRERARENSDVSALPNKCCHGDHGFLYKLPQSDTLATVSFDQDC